MGIKHLHKFIRSECKNSIRPISLYELSGKKIAIDISIYIFKYAADGGLIENIYLMLTLFTHYNIVPIFIFDGKPPAEKKELILRRREDRKEAEIKYNLLKQQLDSDDIDDEDISNSMDVLKKKLINITKNDFDNVKKLITAYGCTYYDAPGEADELCAYLTIKGKVWACLSEDMDMFVYGCTRVIRFISLINKTAVLYDHKGILHELKISQKELREICVLSGTDYNIQSHSDADKYCPTLYNTLKLFKKYKKNKTHTDFYDWVGENTTYIVDYDMLLKINTMFDICQNEELKVFDSIKIMNGCKNVDMMADLLKTVGFIFPDK
jgi:hypothetical protein